MGKSGATKDIDSMGSSICVKLPNGQSLSITLHRFDQMSKVYSLVSTETGSKDNLIRIKFTGKVLKKHQTASNLGIVEGMDLKAEVSGFFHTCTYFSCQLTDFHWFLAYSKLSLWNYSFGQAQLAANFAHFKAIYKHRPLGLVQQACLFANILYLSHFPLTWIQNACKETWHGFKVLHATMLPLFLFTSSTQVFYPVTMAYIHAYSCIMCRMDT